MDGWICVLIIFLVGLACVVACLVWHAKFGFDKEMVQDLVGGLFELVRELVGGLFGWVWEFVEELIDEVGIDKFVLWVMYFVVCCFVYWALGYAFGATDGDWEQYFAAMTGVGFLFGIILGFFFGLMCCFDMGDEAIEMLLLPWLVSGLGFLVFGVITIVIRLAG